MSHDGTGGADSEGTQVERAQPTLTERQQEILSFIERAVRQTGVAPSRSEIAQAMGLKGTSSVEGHLLALARKGSIVLERKTHRSIRIADRNEAKIIDPPDEVACAETLTSERYIVDRMPGTLALRVTPAPDFLLWVHDDGLEGLGIVRGDLAAVRQGIPIRDGAIVLARDEHGAVLYRRAVVTDDHEVQLTRTGTVGASDGWRRRRCGSERALRIDGLLVGAVQVRSVGQAKESGRPMAAHTARRQRGGAEDGAREDGKTRHRCARRSCWRSSAVRSADEGHRHRLRRWGGCSGDAMREPSAGSSSAWSNREGSC